MNWDAIGSIGEVVGAIGVIATLIYLAAQIRQNAAATRADIRQSLAEQQTQFINSRATDPFLRASMEKVYGNVELDKEEMYGVTAHVIAHIRLFENYFAQYRLGTMDDQDWTAMRNLIARHIALAPYQNTFESIRGMCNSAFVEEMDRIAGVPKTGA